MIHPEELLAEYRLSRSESALQELMRQHLGLVYFVAKRVTGSEMLAQEAAQEVFIKLAKNPRSVPAGLSLAAWLHRSTRSIAMNLVRSETRRRRREAIAHELHSMNESSLENEDLSHMVDEAMDGLPRADRSLLAAHFMEGLSFSQMATRLGIQENAARMRTHRALEKMRRQLSKRGITTSAAAIATVLPAGATSAVPSGVASAVFSNVLAGTSVATTASGLGIFLTMKLKSTLIAVACVGLLAIPIWQHAKLDSLQSRRAAAVEAHMAERARIGLTRTDAAPNGGGYASMSPVQMMKIGLQLASIPDLSERDAALAKWAATFTSNEAVLGVIAQMKLLKPEDQTACDLIVPHLTRQWALVAPVECIAAFTEGAVTPVNGTVNTEPFTMCDPNINCFALIATANPEAFSAWSSELSGMDFTGFWKESSGRLAGGRILQTLCRYAPQRMLDLLIETREQTGNTMYWMRRDVFGVEFYHALRESMPAGAILKELGRLAPSGERTDLLMMAAEDEMKSDQRPIAAILTELSARPIDELGAAKMAGLGSRLKNDYAASKAGGETALDQWFAGVKTYAETINAGANGKDTAYDLSRKNLATLLAREDMASAMLWADSVVNPVVRIQAAAFLAAYGVSEKKFDPAAIKVDANDPEKHLYDVYYAFDNWNPVNQGPVMAGEVEMIRGDSVKLDSGMPLEEVVRQLKLHISSLPDQINATKEEVRPSYR